MGKVCHCHQIQLTRVTEKGNSQHQKSHRIIKHPTTIKDRHHKDWKINPERQDGFEHATLRM